MQRYLLTVAFATAAVLAACSDGPTGAPGSAVGEYELLGRNGHPLPVQLSTSDSLMSGTLSMAADSTFVAHPRYKRMLDGHEWTTTIAGRWSARATVLTYRSQSGDSIASGTYGRGGVTFLQAGEFYEFARR